MRGHKDHRRREDRILRHHCAVALVLTLVVTLTAQAVEPDKKPPEAGTGLTPTATPTQTATDASADSASIDKVRQYLKDHPEDVLGLVRDGSPPVAPPQVVLEVLAQNPKATAEQIRALKQRVDELERQKQQNQQQQNTNNNEDTGTRRRTTAGFGQSPGGGGSQGPSGGSSSSAPAPAPAPATSTAQDTKQPPKNMDDKNAFDYTGKAVAGAIGGSPVPTKPAAASAASSDLALPDPPVFGVPSSSISLISNTSPLQPQANSAPAAIAYAPQPRITPLPKNAARPLASGPKGGRGGTGGWNATVLLKANRGSSRLLASARQSKPANLPREKGSLYVPVVEGSSPQTVYQAQLAQQQQWIQTVRQQQALQAAQMAADASAIQQVDQAPAPPAAPMPSGHKN